MAQIRKSDGTIIEVPDEDVWGPPLTAEEQAQFARERMPAVTRTQFAIACAGQGILTAAEAKDFAAGNALPTWAILAIHQTDMTESEKLAAELKALSTATVERLSPVVDTMRQAKGMTQEQADSLFTAAAQIE